MMATSVRRQIQAVLLLAVLAARLPTIEAADRHCEAVPTPKTAVTLEACTNGLGNTIQWQLSQRGIPRPRPNPSPNNNVSSIPDPEVQWHIVLAADPTLCLDVDCSATLEPCVGGPDPDGIMWWGPAAQITPCSADTSTFKLFRNGSIGVSSSKPGVPAGLCLATMLVYDIKFGGRAVQASPCGVSPQNQAWNITAANVFNSGDNVTLVMAGGTAAGFCATACKNPPTDPDSFCPRYHPIHGGNVYDASGPLFDDESGTWHLFDDDGGWSHWRSKDLVHWSLSENTTHFSTDTGSLSPTASGIYAHWPVVQSNMGNKCCQVVKSAKATDASLSRWAET